MKVCVALALVKYTETTGGGVVVSTGLVFWGVTLDLLQEVAKITIAVMPPYIKFFIVKSVKVHL